MGLRSEQGYNMEVTSASLIQSRKGTMGFQIGLECSDGETEFTIWLTPNNRQNILDSFKALDVDPSSAPMHSRSYLENQLPMAIVGKVVYAYMKDEPYNGETKTKVSWIGKKREDSGGLAENAANFLSEMFGSEEGGKSDSELGF